MLATSQKIKVEIPTLVWLFTAYFADGTTIRQTQKSEIGHSMMIDVNAKAKESKLTHFELHHIDGDKVVTVDLTTGAFIVNGIPMQAQEDFSFEKSDYWNPAGKDLELHYWREKLEQADFVATVNESGGVDLGEMTGARSAIGRYFIGWKCGEHKAVIAVG